MTVFLLPILAIVLFLCSVSLYRQWQNYRVFSSTPFDRQVWLKAKGLSPENPRGPMLYDLMNHHLREGMTRQDVLNLLGKPEGSSIGYSGGGETLGYYIGLWSSHPELDGDYLEFGMDDTGRVACYGHYWVSASGATQMKPCLDR